MAKICNKYWRTPVWGKHYEQMDFDLREQTDKEWVRLIKWQLLILSWPPPSCQGKKTTRNCVGIHCGAVPASNAYVHFCGQIILNLLGCRGKGSWKSVWLSYTHISMLSSPLLRTYMDLNLSFYMRKQRKVTLALTAMTHHFITFYL